MTAKEYLSQVRNKSYLISAKYAELEELRAKRSMISANDYSKDRVKTSAPYEGGFENLSLKLLEAGRRLDQQIDEYIDLREKIKAEILSLNEPYAAVLYYRYILFTNLEDIADTMHYSYEYTRHLHGWALQKFAEKYLNTK